MSESIRITPLQAQKLADLESSIESDEPGDVQLEVENDYAISSEILTVRHLDAAALSKGNYVVKQSWLIGRDGGVIER